MSGGNQNTDRQRQQCCNTQKRNAPPCKRQQQEQKSQQQQQQPQQQQQKSQQIKKISKKILYNWEIAEDDTGQFVIGLLMEDNEQKDWETNYLTKIVLHRLYLEGFTDSGSIYVMEYKHAKPGGHTVYTFIGDN